jgi:hypothetical protein
LDTAALPNLKELFRDETIGCCAVDLVGEKIVLHSDIYGPVGRERLGVLMEVANMIFTSLKDKGVEKLYTWAETDEQYNFNLHMGFTPTGEEVLFDPPQETPIYEFVRVL